jgi:DNA-binding transcriptional LysR family regulator
MIDLNELALFHQVVRAGSFAEAARRVGVPANTLSRKIVQLEGRLDIRLLQRTTRKLTLTDAGRSLFEASAQPIDDALQATRQLLEAGQAPSGGVRIAVTADFFEFFQMAWVAEFLAAHPKVRLDFVLSDDLTDLIADSIDIAFRGGAQKDSTFIARKLGRSDLVLAASPGYLNAKGTPASFQDLASHYCITTGKPGRVVWRAEGAAGPESVEVRGPFGANTTQSQVRAAQAGLGICFVPVTQLTRSLQSGALVAVLPRYRQETAGFYVVYPNRKQIPKSVSAFLDMTFARAAEAAWL